MKGCMENRELSWLKFNDRVLLQAKDAKVPLAERLTFISIYQTNLDEFFRVRLGSTYDQMLFYPSMRENKTGMTAEEQLRACCRKIKILNRKKDRIYHNLMHDLEAYGLTILKCVDVKDKETRKYLDSYFKNEILPMMSPQTISKRTPFPFLSNGDLYMAVQLESKKGKRKLGILSITTATDERLIALPHKPGTYILIEDLIAYYLQNIFKSHKVIASSVIRITRSADIDEDDYSLRDHHDYREMMETLIKQRRRLKPLRLEYTPGLNELELDMIAHFLDIESYQCFISESPLTFSYVFKLQKYLQVVHPELFYAPLVPKNSPMVENRIPMIKQILKRDIFLSYPYESIVPFLRLLDEAAEDPQVVSIKMTLYRVADNSRVVRSLIKAADNGKEVVVLVELRARFDEENNISWSKALEAAGCHVIYGLEGLKVHSKLCLITMRENNQIRYITQVGTGNYNEKTARLYTDLCLMTSRQSLGQDAAHIFNNLAQGETNHDAKELLVAPHLMLSSLMSKIDEQIALAKDGKEAFIGFKCNAVTSRPMMNKLIEASQAGVTIKMIVRGICCLIPGIPGITENIEVISIVGRYLEHSRIYIFGAANPEVYISSADLMTRNLECRVEVAAPVYDQKIKQMILDMFYTMLKDNVKASRLLPDGKYKRVKNKQPKINSQEYFFKRK